MSSFRNGHGEFNPAILRNETKDISDVRVKIDLVTAARRHLGLLRTISESQFSQDISALRQSIRRYDELWMPLLSDITNGPTRPILLPPLDIQWVWHCHALNPVNYRKYCESRFSKILEKPVILDDGNEEYALNRCRDVWSYRYPSEPFELETFTDGDSIEIVTDEDILHEVMKHKFLYSKFSEPYMSEIVYLISAKERYLGFLNLMKRFKDGAFKFVPTLDVQLMWLTHQSYPLIYAEDVKEIEGNLGRVVGVWDSVKDEDVEGTKKVWEGAFQEPYEKAGATLDGVVGSTKSPTYWDVWDADANTKYKSMTPRFLSEVCVFVKANLENNQTQPKEKKKNKKHDFLCIGTIRCHRQLKLDTAITSISSHTWQKICHLYCEFGTKGLILEIRHHHGKACFKTTSSRSTITFLWNELLCTPNLTLRRELGKKVHAVASVTPPTQAPYLLKCVPDRVTDDSGAMVSDVILKMNGYRPQEGRWLSRTALDHAGRECFVVRIRVADGFWRRGGEVPKAVKREERIVEVREGSWSYVAGSIGRAPEKVVGTATPKEEWREEEVSWSLSTGDELTIQWTPSGFTFHLHNHTSPDEVRLLKGKKMQYQVNNANSDSKEEEEEFVTLVRYTPKNPNGRATALMNWRLLVMEIVPEEDVVRVLMVCIAILRSVSEMMKQDVGKLLVRRRMKEPKLGLRDWGSVMLHPSSCSSISNSSSPHLPHLQPWYWNAKAVMASVEADDTTQSIITYSAAEGGDKLYKQGIIPNS